MRDQILEILRHNKDTRDQCHDAIILMGVVMERLEEERDALEMLLLEDIE